METHYLGIPQTGHPLDAAGLLFYIPRAVPRASQHLRGAFRDDVFARAAAGDALHVLLGVRGLDINTEPCKHTGAHPHLISWSDRAVCRGPFCGRRTGWHLWCKRSRYNEGCPLSTHLETKHRHVTPGLNVCFFKEAGMVQQRKYYCHR